MKAIYKHRLISGMGLLIAACLFVGATILVNTCITSWRIDLTENKLFTLSEGTKNILSKLEEPIILDFYFSKGGMNQFPQLAHYGTRIRDMLEEYLAHANGKIILNVIDPEPFSEEEDQAVASGIQGIAINNAGERAYFGLLGTNPTDDERLIPFFQTSRETFVEYDISKLIYNLASPDKRTVGIMSTLPVFADPASQRPEWTIISALREFFELREIDPNAVLSHRDQDLDVLILIHPKDFSEPQYYALDQYLLRGGKALIFLDPLAEQDKSINTGQPGILPKLDSYLEKLLDHWGLAISQEKLVADINAAMQVKARGPSGLQTVNYLPWLRLTKDNFNQQDLSTNELNLLHIGTAGNIHEKQERTSPLQISPLIQTSSEAMLLERDLILFQPDPTVILNNFQSTDQRYTIAARIHGTINTAYPNGRPATDEQTQTDDPKTVTEGEINVILVADTDILADHFWIRPQTVLGVSVPKPISNNGHFVLNSVEHLSGDHDLISLRGRGEYARPFKVVAEIRKQAESQFRKREQQLKDQLKETEQKLQDLQHKLGPKGGNILSTEQLKEIEKFRKAKLKIRKELRAVQHSLKKDIERLGTQLRFINILLIPLLILVFGLTTWFYRLGKHT